MVDSPNVIEYEDVLVDETTMGFPNHGQLVCVASLHDKCVCPKCKPKKSRHWKISYCKYGFKPSLFMKEEPRGCTFLSQPDGYYCKPYCSRYDKETKAKAFEEVFGYKGKLDMDWKPALEDWEKEIDEILDTFTFAPMDSVEGF